MLQETLTKLLADKEKASAEKEERKRREKEEAMKTYLEAQTKKQEVDEATARLKRTGSC